MTASVHCTATSPGISVTLPAEDAGLVWQTDTVGTMAVTSVRPVSDACQHVYSGITDLSNAQLSMTAAGL